MAHDQTNVQLAHIFLIRSMIIMLGAYVYGKRDSVNFSLSRVREFPIRM